jgi:hypothetical protein
MTGEIMNISFGNLITTALIAGIFGTASMTIFLQIISKTGVANADMVRALGSLFTKSLDSAFSVGIIIHSISGLFFAFLYTIVITALNIHGVPSCAGSGTLIGFIHGGIVSFLLVASVAERHPLPEFQKAGFSVAAAHWIAHIIYGFIVGIVIGLIGY